MKTFVITLAAIALVSCMAHRQQSGESPAKYGQKLNTTLETVKSSVESGSLKLIITELNRTDIQEEFADGANRILNFLRNKADSLPQPDKSVVYSMIAQIYEDYYNRNIRTVNKRTKTNISKDDVHTFDAVSLAEEAVKYYRLSLLEAGLLQDVPVERYKDILTAGNEHLPTLYDVLANRALKYYSSRFNVNSLPRQMFVIKNPDYFADAARFVEMSVETADSLSPSYLALTVYQELLRFHLKKIKEINKDTAKNFDTQPLRIDTQPFRIDTQANNFEYLSDENDDIAALIDADLRRIEFIKNSIISDNAELMYIQALQRCSEIYRPYPRNSRVLLRLAGCYLQQGQRWQSKKSELDKSGYTRAMEICRRIQRDYPQELKENVAAMQAIIEQTSLSVTTEETQLPDKPFLAHIAYRNIRTLHVTAYPLTEDEVLKYHYGFRRYNSAGKYLLHDFVNNLSGVPLRQVIEIPENSDYQQYKTLIMMNAMASGMYLVLFSDTENCFAQENAVSYRECFLKVSSIATQSGQFNDNLSIFVTDRDTGAPLSGAGIKVFCDKDTIINLTSNRDGFARLRMADLINKQTKYYIVSFKGDKLYCFEHHNLWSLHPQTMHNAAILTDRAKYRPGQTVYFKAILYDRSYYGEKNLRTDEPVDVNLRDVNNIRISTLKLTSNDYGSVDGSFTIPQGALNGRMMIECDDYGSLPIIVEEYKRPAFEVEFDKVNEPTALGGEVKVKATARALAGYAVDNAKVRYRIQRMRASRYPRLNESLPFIMENDEVGSGVTTTDARGEVEISFTAIADDLIDDTRIHVYTVTADVTDGNGETRSASLKVPAGFKPLLVKTDIPADILLDSANTYSVSATNLADVPTPAHVNVEIVAIAPPDGLLRKLNPQMRNIDYNLIKEDEFRRNFPLDAYGDELNEANFKELETVARYEIDTDKDRRLDLSALKRTGYYKIILHADNGKGFTVDNTEYFYLRTDYKDKIISLDKWLTAAKTVCEPGENAELLIAGREIDSKVYCEVVHNDSIIYSRWLTASSTPVLLSIPVEETHRGGFTVQTRMIQHNRLYENVTQINVPYTNKMLDVSLATFRDKLLPGQNESWTMTVADKQGGKSSAEVAATLYDASTDKSDMFSQHSWPDFSSLYFKYNPASRWNASSIINLVRPFCNTNLASRSWNIVPVLADLNWEEATYRKLLFANSNSLLRNSNLRMGAMAFDDNNQDFFIRGTGEADNFAQNTVVAFGKQTTEDNALRVPEIIQIDENAVYKKTDYNLDSDFGSDNDSRFNLTQIATRTNFNETAFFYPTLRTDSAGKVLIEFTIPEALTRWKLLSFAHTRDFKIGTYTNELITQKQVAVSANPPRFFREKDEIVFTAKVNNLTAADLTGKALLRLYDALT
ncbi:MAG: hypothetical protein LBS80_02915, partial [Tannerella sp.]|nr:hypothetical protein [Tannerella sp.]